MSKTALRILVGGLILVALIGLGFFAYRALRPAPVAAVNTQWQAYQKLSQASQTPLELTLQNGFPRGVVGKIHVDGATPAERAQAFLDEYGDFYQQSDPNLELHLRRVGGVDLEDVLFYQTYAGIPVYGAEFLVSTHGEDVFATAGGLLPGGVDLDLLPALAPQDAEALARAALGQPEDAPIFGVTELVIYEPSIIADSPFEPHLAWRITIGDRDPRVARALLTETSERVMSFVAEFSGHAFANVRQRIARHLLDLASDHQRPDEFLAPISQQELADAVGTVREVVVRILRELREEGVVQTGRDGIVIRDPERLSGASSPPWNESP